MKVTNDYRFYQLTADSYKNILERDRNNMTAEEIEDIEANIRVFDLLASFSEDDKYIIFDAALFNDILRGYCLKAMDEFLESDDDEIREAAEVLRSKLQGKISSLLDRMDAHDAERYYFEH